MAKCSKMMYQYIGITLYTSNKRVLLCMLYAGIYLRIIFGGRFWGSVQAAVFFHFFPKIWSAKVPCRKAEASQGFWYQGVGADVLFRN